MKDGMGEEEKVKAIHDYLIYHANYVNNGDYSTAENWAYGAGGVLLHKEGVCQSYAFAFYMMAISAGLECRFVSVQQMEVVMHGIRLRLTESGIILIVHGMIRLAEDMKIINIIYRRAFGQIILQRRQKICRRMENMIGSIII